MDNGVGFENVKDLVVVNLAKVLLGASYNRVVSVQI